MATSPGRNAVNIDVPLEGGTLDEGAVALNPILDRDLKSFNNAEDRSAVRTRSDLMFSRLQFSKSYSVMASE